ncbi:MAG TPA: M36 family metallopeptidase [Candidatus Acidoferrum sp.]|nr:M36 family metallopeptidase [Candidatus Acidoferrum sp.]
MSINFIPNDPQAGPTAPALRAQPKRANRPSTKSGFTFTGVAPEGTFNPGTPQFLFWQCREAGLSALQAWEASDGPHKRWQGNRKKLPLQQDTGVDLNAFYDRDSFSFFHAPIGTKTFFSGASTDVVAHEVGHGLLDSIRPDLWDTPLLEAGAFHEAFGDCLALLASLNDKETRQKLLTVTANLRKRNFLESTAEDLSDGIKRIQPTHNAAEPRHAFNTLQFQIPETLPDNGGPGELINEVHSFGMLFSGAFYDVIANIFEAAATHTEASLLTAAQTAGHILIEGTKLAPVTARFLQSVGRSMVLADEQMNAAANRDQIRAAFQAHGILLGTNAMVAPSVALAGAAPRGRAAALAPSTRRDLLRRLGDKRGAKLILSKKNLFGHNVVEAAHRHEVPLGAVDKRLKGAVASIQVPVMVGASGKRAVVLGGIQDATNTEDEVQSFVKSLLTHDQLQIGGKATAKATARATARAKGLVSATSVGTPTHEIKTEGGKRVLRRLRFTCA